MFGKITWNGDPNAGRAEWRVGRGSRVVDAEMTGAHGGPVECDQDAALQDPVVGGEREIFVM
ncbi:hypothetical protein BH23GEM9_BH23GEM9_36950 [soil metagenome]